MVGELISERFECLASELGTGNKSNPERSPSAANAAKISSRSVRSRVDRRGWELEEDEDCKEILKPTPRGGLQNDILWSGLNPTIITIIKDEAGNPFFCS